MCNKNVSIMMYTLSLEISEHHFPVVGKLLIFSFYVYRIESKMEL